MGFLDKLAGRTKILTYEVGFSETFEEVGVKIRPSVPVVQTPDYIRLWVSYWSKIVYNLGYPDGDGQGGINMMVALVDTPIDSSTDCFQRVGFDIRFAPVMPSGRNKFSGITGEFYDIGSGDRTIITSFPREITTSAIIFCAGLALMQYAIHMNRGDDEALQILGETGRGVARLFTLCKMAGEFDGVKAAAGIPNLAYKEAIGIR